jgi:hypothetical protein
MLHVLPMRTIHSERPSSHPHARNRDRPADAGDNPVDVMIPRSVALRLVKTAGLMQSFIRMVDRVVGELRGRYRVLPSACPRLSEMLDETNHKSSTTAGIKLASPMYCGMQDLICDNVHRVNWARPVSLPFHVVFTVIGIGCYERPADRWTFGKKCDCRLPSRLAHSLPKMAAAYYAYNLLAAIPSPAG